MALRISGFRLTVAERIPALLFSSIRYSCAEKQRNSGEPAAFPAGFVVGVLPSRPIR